MTESGDPLENTIAERINGILKTEWIYDVKLKSWQETINFVSRIIEILKRNANGRIIIERGIYLMKKFLYLIRSVKA